jgi:hypothetical protein
MIPSLLRGLVYQIRVRDGGIGSVHLYMQETPGYTGLLFRFVRDKTTEKRTLVPHKTLHDVKLISQSNMPEHYH